jgi:large subunit ribosomal protein L4
MAVPTYTKSGTKATTAAKLDKGVFGVAVQNHELLKQAYVAYLANGRENLARTKTRGEVSGGGRKPWKQKGTGRARFGSSRVPIWRGGGITFGPTGLENYSHKLPTATKRVALRQALTTAAEANKVVVLEDIGFNGKTTEAVKLLEKIGAKRSTLIVVESKSPELERSVSNLREVKLVTAKYLNVYDILNADNIVFTTKALSIVHEWLGGKA